MVLMKIMQASSEIFVLYLLLLLLSSLGPSPCHGWRELCPKFSCGPLHNLTFPFRLKEYPVSCGRPEYELSCDGNAILYFNGSTLYVTAVSYLPTNFGFSRATLQVVDPRFSNSACTLPLPSLSCGNLYYEKGLSLESGSSWISFLNCSKPIQKNNASYLALPCLSHDNSLIYAVQAQTVEYLKPSCRYLSMAVLGANTTLLMVNSEKDLFKILGEQSFNLMDGVFSLLNACILEPSRTKEHQSWLMILDLIIQSIIQPSMSMQINPLNFFWSFLMHISLGAAAILVRFFIAPLILYIYLGMVLWKSRVIIDPVEKFLQNQKRLSPIRYTYGDLIAITRNFKEKLGEGGFGSVFRGELLCGVPVAVKLLKNSQHDGEEFISEVSTIGRIHHVNIVKLVGFCSDGSKRALIYEYMVNGSLEKFIFSSDGANNIYHLYSSKKLIDIALGVSRAIDYLHRGCDMQILHFDIKPQNVLLDYHFTPKVADFGLARLYPRDNSLISISSTRGTIGYIAPELISRSFGPISYKSDVYSFGMLLLEMAGGRRNVNRQEKTSSRTYYPSWIYDKLDRNIEEEGMGVEIEINEVEKKLSMIGLWCIQLRPTERPTMDRVIEMLEDDISTLQMPPKPFFSSMEPMPEQYSYFCSSFTDLSAIIE